jgi:hypothetical protein
MTGFPPPSSGRGLWGNFTRHPIWAAVIAGLIVAGVLGVIHHFSTPSGASAISGSTPSGGSSPVPTSSGSAAGSSFSGSIASESLPRSLVGRWQGTVIQYNTSQQYPASLSFYSAPVGSPVGQSMYSTLECGGTLRLMAVDGNTIQVTEYITQQPTGMNKCITPESLSITFNSDGTLTYQELSDSTTPVTVIGQGTLHRS